MSTPDGAAYVALTGNPNSGKTTLFNALTGLRAKVGNYAGVTVERKEGRLLDTPPDQVVKILDLPGSYSLSPQSLDEQISRDVLLRRLPDVPAPKLVVVVVDASNLQRNLYFATQVIELGTPTVIALNMIDVAEGLGAQIDCATLSSALGVPVIPIVASTKKGIPELRQHLLKSLKSISAPVVPRRFCELPDALNREVAGLEHLLAAEFHENDIQAAAEALLILCNEKAMASSLGHYPDSIEKAVAASRARIEAAGIDWRSTAIEARYAAVAAVCEKALNESHAGRETFSDKLDKVVTHKLWGTVIFVAIMAVMFQSIFTFAQIPMAAIGAGVKWCEHLVEGALPPGDLNSLLSAGVVGGVGAVVMFLPQILLLFFFIGLLEDTGYMARAAFLMDRLMSKVGLHGKSFIPMLSSFACAIPGIMATRTIETPKDRLVTILVAPLMSCSARLPVYLLLIGACIPNRHVLGFIPVQGLTLLSMYLLGIVGALLMAWFFKKTLLRGETPLLIMELPPYKRPLLKVVLRHMWDRARLFLRRAGTVILGISILLWFLAAYPRSSEIRHRYDAAQNQLIASGEPANSTNIVNLKKLREGEELRYSFAGRVGNLIEPAIAPLGYDWKMGIGIVSSFAAREVFVSTMATVYNVGKDLDPDETRDLNILQHTLAEEKRNDNVTPAYTPLVAVSLMVFYVFALQCASTVAVVRRETNSWRWPIFQWLYMAVLAWGLSFITYQGGKLLGWQ